MTKVKICGITTLEDALVAARAGADMLGFNFHKQSPRFITQDAALNICTELRKQLGTSCPVLVGIFVNEIVSNISNTTSKVGLNFAQLSGDESDSILKELRGLGYKGIQPMTKEMALDDVKYYKAYFPTNERAPSLLLDAYHPKLRGGTGEQTSTEVAVAVREQVPRLMLAGGLTPDNVAGRIKAIGPWGVDVASGVEGDTPGRKDAAKVQAFVEAVRSVST